MSVSFGFCPSSECTAHERPPVSPDEANMHQRGAWELMTELGLPFDEPAGDLDADDLYARLVCYLALEPDSEPLSAVTYRPRADGAVLTEGGQAAGAVQRRMRVLLDVCEYARSGCGQVHYS